MPTRVIMSSIRLDTVWSVVSMRRSSTRALYPRRMISCLAASARNEFDPYIHRGVGSIPAPFFDPVLIPRANDVLFGGLGTCGVIADAVSHHIDPHSSGRLIGRLPIELFQHAFE